MGIKIHEAKNIHTHTTISGYQQFRDNLNSTYFKHIYCQMLNHVFEISRHIFKWEIPVTNYILSHSKRVAPGKNFD